MKYWLAVSIVLDCKKQFTEWGGECFWQLCVRLSNQSSLPSVMLKSTMLILPSTFVLVISWWNNLHMCGSVFLVMLVVYLGLAFFCSVEKIGSVINVPIMWKGIPLNKTFVIISCSFVVLCINVSKSKWPLAVGKWVLQKRFPLCLMMVKRTASLWRQLCGNNVFNN